MERKKLNEVLEAHRQWLNHGADGRRADLRGADLSDADLSDADLRRADLHGADLRRADLRRADLSDANLRGADLSDADLSDADLRRADLSDADLRRADLHGADLRGADLRRADLSDANLRGADLSDADLRRADLRDAVLPHSSNCPEEGAFVGFKKLGHGTVCKLSIPAEARRVSALCGRKCRAEFADVVEGEGKSSRGLYYETAKRVHPDSFDDDIRVECSNGIHFFLTRREAEEW